MKAFEGLNVLMIGSAIGFQANYNFENLIKSIQIQSDSKYTAIQKAKNPRIEKIKKIGLPGLENITEMNGQISSPNLRLKIPNWTVHLLESSDISGPVIADRKQSQFNSKIDSIKTEHKAENNDQFRSGWSRGHMVPCGDLTKIDQKSMDDSHILNVNIVPQDFDNNANYWYRMEIHTKKNLLKKFDRVWITSGPFFKSNDIVDQQYNNDKLNKRKFIKGKKAIQSKIIGENEVQVPNYLFKCYLAERNNEFQNACFVVPNRHINEKTDLMDQQTDYSIINKTQGLDLQNKILNLKNLCDLDKANCELMSGYEQTLYDFERKISWQRSKKDFTTHLENFKSRIPFVKVIVDIIGSKESIDENTKNHIIEVFKEKKYVVQMDLIDWIIDKYNELK